MKENMLLSISGLLFSILLSTMYFIRSKKTGVNNKIFKLALITLTITVISEIVAICVVNFYPDNILLKNIFTRINIIITMTWIMIMCSYVLTIGRAHQIGDLIKFYFKTPRMMPLTLGYILFVGLSLFLKPEYVITDSYSYLSGLSIYALYLWGSAVIAISVIFMIVKSKNIYNVKKLPLVIGIIETVISMTFQFLYPMILIITQSFVFKMYLLFFMFESPDLYLVKALEISKQEAENSNRAKTEFLSNMSHDIRTPMNSIMGLSEGIKKDKSITLDRAVSDMNNINAMGKNLLDIIDNILDISKIESGEERVENKEYNLKKFIFDVKNLGDIRLGDKDVKLVMNVDQTLPAKLVGDRKKLFQAVINILSNAIKYTEIGKIMVTFSSKNVANNKVLLHIEVCDTGTGIKKEDFPKLFEKFSRLDNAVQNEVEGTGLGLVIAKNFVELMSGKIWVESVYGAGSTFFIELEQEFVDHEAVGHIAFEASGGEETNYKDYSGKKVLVVDDNSLNLKVIEKLLKPYNFTITKFDNGRSCIDSIKAGDTYDILFLDHMMPNMDGIEVVSVLRKLRGYKLPVIVALTANAIVGAKEMYLKNGFDDYISKPVNIKELDDLINKILN